MKARSIPESRFRKISMETRGIAFSGTPHRGSNIDHWLEDLTFSLRKHHPIDINQDIVGVLRAKSEVSSIVEGDFGNINTAPKFCCFIPELHHGKYGMVRHCMARKLPWLILQQPVPSHPGSLHDQDL